MNQVMAVILSVLPNLIAAIQAIIAAVEGGKPVTPAQLDALKAALNDVHTQVSAAVAPTAQP